MARLEVLWGAAPRHTNPLTPAPRRRSVPKLPKFSETELKGSEDYLFVPNDHVVSFYPVGYTEKDVEGLRAAVKAPMTERVTHLFSLCFVDASNLNRFKDALDVSSRVSEHDKAVLHALQVRPQRSPYVAPI